MISDIQRPVSASVVKSIWRSVLAGNAGPVDPIFPEKDFYFADFAGIALVLHHHARFGRNPGNTEQAGLVVKRAAHFFQRELFDLHQVEQGARIERARASAHHQAVECGKAHRGGDALQVLHRAQAGPAAEVCNDGAAARQITVALGQDVAHVVV